MSNQLTLDARTYGEAKWNFEIPPEPVDESEVAETRSCEILVIGAGISGLVTAARAAELGADVRLFSASSHPISRGGSNCGWGTKVQKRHGIEFNAESDRQRIKQEIASNAGRVDLGKWYRWINNSARTMDWLIDLMEAEGYETTLEAPYIDIDGVYTQKPMSHNWIGGPVRVGAMGGAALEAQVLEKNALAWGAQIDYNAKALYLEKDEGGRVVGAIARRNDGTVLRYRGSKAVVLATGDFSADKDLMAKYCPDMAPYYSDATVDYDREVAFFGTMPGDGQKMGLWAGAAWQYTPNAPQANLDVMGPAPSHLAMGNHPGINLNGRGERFMNEDTTLGYAIWQGFHQPGGRIYYIWDSAFYDRYPEWAPFGTTIEGTGGPKPFGGDRMREIVENSVTAGRVVKADTAREALAGLDGIDVDAALATIGRYNAYCQNGLDEEFHKNAAHLSPIEEGPFYATCYDMFEDGSWLSVFGGLRTNIHNQVCDENDQPIPGLYNVGIMTGDTNVGIYNFVLCGMSLGMNCITLPQLMVEEILGE